MLSPTVFLKVKLQSSPFIISHTVHIMKPFLQIPVDSSKCSFLVISTQYSDCSQITICVLYYMYSVEI